KFSFVPAGFFGRVMVRLLGFNLDKVEKYWRYGLVVSNHPEKVKVEFNPKENELFISVRTENESGGEKKEKKKAKKGSKDEMLKPAENKKQKRSSADEVPVDKLDVPGEKKKKGPRKGSTRRKQERKHREKSLQTLSLLVFAAVDSLITDWYEL